MSDNNDYTIPTHLDSGASTHDDSNGGIPAPEPSSASTADPMKLPTNSIDIHGLLDNNSVDVPPIDSDLGHHDFGDFDPSLYGTGFDDFNGDNRMYGLDFDGIELPLADHNSN